MSTDHQQYSTRNQSDRIREYAAKRGFDIIRTYADAGKSGLTIGGRQALQSLIQDVQSGSADFQTILVYDVSRWGRFQDADESAYYEYICRRAGIQVTYCAEQFENDGSPVSTIVKGVKRAMAAEYSRELSTKVFRGQCRLIELGFRQGGTPGFGLRRALIDQRGAKKTVLSHGERKSLQTDRIILVPGPDWEVELVNRMYRWYVDDGQSIPGIARRLNELQVLGPLGRPWNQQAVTGVLTNERYIGDNIFNRVSSKLSKRRIANSREMWIRKNGAFQPIVPPEVFRAAQDLRLARNCHITNDEMIDRLRALYSNFGYLSGRLIDRTDGMPRATLYKDRFGMLTRAYERVGFVPRSSYHHLEVHQVMQRLHPEITAEIQRRIVLVGGVVVQDPITRLMRVNDEFNISVVLASCVLGNTGNGHWRVKLESSLKPDITVVVRLEQNNRAVLDYFLFPRDSFDQTALNLSERNALEFQSYRFDTLDFLYRLCEPTRLERTA